MAKSCSHRVLLFWLAHRAPHASLPPLLLQVLSVGYYTVMTAQAYVVVRRYPRSVVGMVNNSSHFVVFLLAVFVGLVPLSMGTYVCVPVQQRYCCCLARCLQRYKCLQRCTGPRHFWYASHVASAWCVRVGRGDGWYRAIRPCWKRPGGVLDCGLEQPPSVFVLLCCTRSISVGCVCVNVRATATRSTHREHVDIFMCVCVCVCVCV